MLHSQLQRIQLTEPARQHIRIRAIPGIRAHTTTGGTLQAIGTRIPTTGPHIHTPIHTTITRHITATTRTRTTITTGIRPPTLQGITTTTGFEPKIKFLYQ